jgi:hypothetical protein
MTTLFKEEGRIKRGKAEISFTIGDNLYLYGKNPLKVFIRGQLEGKTKFKKISVKLKKVI